MKQFLGTGLIAVAALALSGCNSGDSVLGGDSGSSSSNSSSSASSDSGTSSSTPTSVRIGSYNGSGQFDEGQAATNRASLDAGESASLTAVLIDQDGNPYTEPVDVFFASTCINSGTSEVDPAVVTNSNGTITATYTARGCSGDDVVTAQTSAKGSSMNASVSVKTEQAPLGSISFESVSRDVIGIQGTGAIPEQAVVAFKVTNATGGPVANQPVDFSLNTTLGGIALSNSQDITDANGIASTTVSAGSVATTVRVTATATRDGKTTTAQSSGLAVSTGIPDQDSFSISASKLNIEGWEYDGITSEVTIRAADRFNNPVPDGTAINFTAEGGSIQSSCLTSSGACSVTFTSQDPRPLDGRVSILATAIGEESFTDSNPSNGKFDDTEEPTLDDLPEAFRNDDESTDVYDAVTDSWIPQRDSSEPYVDFNSNGAYDSADGVFNGLLCDGPGLCAGSDRKSITVYENIVIVLSGSSEIDVDIQPSFINLDGGKVKVVISLKDKRGQVPPVDSAISVSTTQGSIAGKSSFKMLSTANPGPAKFEVTLKQGDAPGEGTFTVEITTPKGLHFSDSVDVKQTVTPP